MQSNKKLDIDWNEVTIAKPLGVSTGLFTSDSPLMQYVADGVLRGTLGCAKVEGGVRFTYNLKPAQDFEASLAFPDALSESDYAGVSIPLLERGWIEASSANDGYTRELQFATLPELGEWGPAQEMQFVYNHLAVIGFVLGAWAEEMWAEYL